MKDNNLLASVALFSELYNNEKYTNVADIIGEFIKAVVVTEKKWTVNSTELTYLLEKVYDFKIPESVVKTTVRNRLKNIVKTQQGYYVFDPIIKDNFAKIDEMFNSILERQNRIINELLKFVEAKEGGILSDGDKIHLIDNLNKYLLDNGVSEKYSKYISAFVIKNTSNQDFTDDLNLIKEGIILYQGIRFTADINELGKWNTELTVFLSTEHLFNALGFNGMLFQQIFDDFYKLVNDINHANRNKNGENLIQLKYLEETKKEYEGFFTKAESILKGTSVLDPSRPAMKAILDGCRNPSDIRNKKIKFENDLKQKGIILKEFNLSIYNYGEYVVEDEGVLEEMRKVYESKGRFFDENDFRELMRIFTKVNYLRGGENKVKFEKIRYIFITGNRFALHLAHQSRVKFQDDDIPFAKDIEYITNKFWFKLKKGFSDKNGLPKSFDVVTKAQIIISSQLNQSIYHEYVKLQQQLKDGSLTTDEARERSYELREKPNKPEEVTVDNIDKSLDFLINDSFFEDMHREKEKQDITLKEIMRENEDLQNEIARRDEIERKKKLAVEKMRLEVDRMYYADIKWREYRVTQNLCLLYFIYVLFITVSPIIIAILLKANKDLSEWLEGKGNLQYFVWIILGLIILGELFGRAYLFNKEKVKAGWLWLRNVSNKNIFKEHKEEQLSIYKNEFQEVKGE